MNFVKEGVLVMTDGLDGSGNGAIIRGLEQWAKNNKLRIFDLVEYCKKNKELPLFEEILDYDVVLSAEPTYAWFGLAIRNEIVRQKDYVFTALSTAQAYSLDREVLFKRLLVPFMRKGGYVFQQRGVVSSLAYQPVQSRFQREESLPVEEIMNLPGNKFILENHPPDLLILTKCMAEVCMERLQKREKQDDSFFEKLNFQKELEKIYASDWLRNVFDKSGTKVVYLDTNPPKMEEDTMRIARKIFEDYLLKFKSKMIVKIKRTRPDARIPDYAHSGDAGVDLYSCEDIVLAPGERALVPTGIKIAIPLGYEAQIRPKSGLALNHGITTLNTPGTIDAGYRGEICVIVINHGRGDFYIEKGKKIAQMVFNKIEKADFEESDDLDETARAEGGFGSSGL